MCVCAYVCGHLMWSRSGVSVLDADPAIVSFQNGNLSKSIRSAAPDRSCGPKHQCLYVNLFIQAL